jgi:hypothetical protein
MTDTEYVISEAISALITALEELGLVFMMDSMEYEYDDDEGQKVVLLSEDIPDFEVKEDELLTISGFDWVVQSIQPYKTDNDVAMYQTVFILEDVI